MSTSFIPIDGITSTNALSRWSGDTGAFDVVSDSEAYGGYALHTSATSGSRITAEPGSLDADFSAGDVMWVSIYGTSGASFELEFGYQGGHDRYFLRVDHNLGEWYIHAVEANSHTPLAYSGSNPPNGVWYDMRIEWRDDGTITVAMYDGDGNFLNEISGQDSNQLYSQGSLSIYTTGTASRDIYLDYFRLEDADGGSSGPTEGDNYENGVPQPNTDGPFGIVDGDVPAGWSATLVDDFDQGSLNTDIWSVGYGWGRYPDWTLEYCRDEDVWVDGTSNRLVLQLDRDSNYSMTTGDTSNGWYSGAVNTRGKHYQQHGYWEACVRLPEPISGVLPGWWSKPNNENHPPEIDFMERYGDVDTSSHTIHWSTDANDLSGSRQKAEIPYDLDGPIHDNFHVFGCNWTPDRVEWYVDGSYVGATSSGSGTTERYLDYGQPFYAMLTCHLLERSDHLGSPESHTGWPYTWEVDWVRVWESEDATGPTTHDITIRVVDEGSNPIGGASVLSEGTFDGTTDTNGEYSTTVPTGDYEIQINADGYYSRTVEMSVPNTIDAEYVLTAESTGTYQASTGTDGVADFGTVPDGDYDLTIEAEGYSTHTGIYSHTQGTTSQVNLQPLTSSEPSGSLRLQWAGNADWSSATDRSGVVSSTFGDRDGDTVQLGWDPNEPPLSTKGVSYYPMDEDTGPIADVIGSEQATLNGPTTGVTGVNRSSAMSFDGVDDHLLISNSSALSSSGEFTIAAVIYPTDLTPAAQTIYRNGAQQGGVAFLSLRGNAVGFGFYSSELTGHYKLDFHSGGLTTGERHLVVGTYSSDGTLRTWVDSENETEPITGSFPGRTAGHNAYIGYQNEYGDRPFDGDIEEVALFDDALTSSEVAELYGALRNGSISLGGKVLSSEDTN